MAGGTAPSLTLSDSATLQQKLKDIVQQTVTVGSDSCTSHLDPKPMAP